MGPGQVKNRLRLLYHIVIYYIISYYIVTYCIISWLALYHIAAHILICIYAPIGICGCVVLLYCIMKYRYHIISYLSHDIKAWWTTLKVRPISRFSKGKLSYYIARFGAKIFGHPSPCASGSDVLCLCLRCRSFRLSRCGPPFPDKNSCMCRISLDFIKLGFSLPIFSVFFFLFLLMSLPSPYKHGIISLAVDLCPCRPAESATKNILVAPVPVLCKPDVKCILHLTPSFVVPLHLHSTMMIPNVQA